MGSGQLGKFLHLAEYKEPRQIKIWNNSGRFPCFVSPLFRLYMGVLVYHTHTLHMIGQIRTIIWDNHQKSAGLKWGQHGRNAVAPEKKDNQPEHKTMNVHHLEWSTKTELVKNNWFAISFSDTQQWGNLIRISGLGEWVATWAGWWSETMAVACTVPRASKVEKSAFGNATQTSRSAQI